MPATTPRKYIAGPYYTRFQRRRLERKLNNAYSDPTQRHKYEKLESRYRGALRRAIAKNFIEGGCTDSDVEDYLLSREGQVLINKVVKAEKRSGGYIFSTYCFFKSVQEKKRRQTEAVESVGTAP